MVVTSQLKLCAVVNNPDHSIQALLLNYLLQVHTGHSNWKDATIAFKKHEGSNCPREAVEVMINLPIGSQLSQQYAKDVATNRAMLLKILSCVKFLARQGLAFRGDEDESDGNFLQLLQLQTDDATMEWLQKKVTNTLLMK